MEEESCGITEITYTDLENICRICMSKDKLKLLSTLLYDNILLSDMYKNYTCLEWDEDDNLPQNICVQCITNLIKVHNFIKKCKTTNDTLIELIKDHEIAITNVNIEEEEEEEEIDENSEEVEEYVYVHMDNDHDYDNNVDKEMLNSLNNAMDMDKEFDDSSDIKETIKLRRRRQFAFKDTLNEAFICNNCGIGFIEEDKYIEHLETHEGEDLFKCEYCSKKFKSNINYENHMFEHKILKDEIEIPIKLICEICNEEFANEDELIQHEDVHGKKIHQCEECDEKYFTTLAFESHKKTHDGFKPFTCTRCDKSFSQFALLKRHFFVHTGHKPFSCNICLKTFSQNAHLKTHFKTHTGERPYLCPYCNKAFALNGNLKVHVRTHTGEKPFLCDICGKGFYHSSTMKKHRVTHVKQE